MFKNIRNKLKGTFSGLAGSALSADSETTMEAMIAATVLVAYADGECSNAEVDKVNQLITSNPQLKEFHNEPVRLFDSYCDQMEASTISGKRDLMKKVLKMSGDVEGSERVLIMAIEVAHADKAEDDESPLGDSEEQVLSDIARQLDLRLGQFI